MADPLAGRLVVVGAGGHAKVIVEVLREAHPELEVVGFTDLDPGSRLVLGLPVLGDDAALERLRRDGVAWAFAALGNNDRRSLIGAHLTSLGYGLPSAVSRRAAVSPSARLGRGVAVMAGAVINAEAVIGDLAIVNSGAVVEHDCMVGRAAHVGPGCAVAGGARIGAHAQLGAGVSVLPGVAIGAGAIVGAGASVIHDLPDGVRAVGVPARVLDPRP